MGGKWRENWRQGKFNPIREFSSARTKSFPLFLFFPSYFPFRLNSKESPCSSCIKFPFYLSIFLFPLPSSVSSASRRTCCLPHWNVYTKVNRKSTEKKVLKSPEKRRKELWRKNRRTRKYGKTVLPFH